MAKEVILVQQSAVATFETQVNSYLQQGYSLSGSPFVLQNIFAQLLVKSVNELPMLEIGEYRLVRKKTTTPWPDEMSKLFAEGWRTYGDSFDQGGQGSQAMLYGDVPVITQGGMLTQ